MQNPVKIVCFALFFLHFSATAEVITDGSLGKAQTLVGSAFQIPQSLGATMGNNLFHSFSQFNLQANESATFTGDSALKNVISRVTGGNPSTINGLLRSAIGNANFYFINPAGITFGATARVNVPAAFHVSTASVLNFADGEKLITNSPVTSQLSIAEPVSFGFLGNQTGNINIEQSKLLFNNNNGVSLSGKDVTIQQGLLNNSSGEIRLYAVGNSQAEIDLQKTPSQIVSGTLVIENSKLISNKEGAGLIDIAAGTVNILNQSQILANNTGLTDADATSGIQIAANRILIDNSAVLTSALSSGNAADISIKTAAGGQLVLHNNGRINSSSANSTNGGNSGNITLNADTIELGRISSISNTINTAGHKQGGSIDVTSQRLNVRNDSAIYTSTSSSSAAGAITIKSDDLNIVNDAQIMSQTESSGNAGDVTINTQRLFVDGQGSRSFSGILSDVNNPKATGHGGVVRVNSDDIHLTNEGTIRSLTLSEFASGYAGDVIVNTKSLLIDNNGRINSDTNQGAKANAGNIRINSDKIALLNQGGITSNSFSAGDAGTVDIQANQILIDGQNNPNQTRISTNTDKTSTGNAGAITVSAADLTILNGGTISSSTFGKAQGNAGTVIVNADNMTIDGKNSPQYTGIFSDSYANLDNNGVNLNKGNANKVSISANTLTLVDTGKISSSTWSAGKAGDVSVVTGQLNITGKETGIFSDAHAKSQGQTGDVSVTARDAIYLDNHARISMRNAANPVNPNAIRATRISVSAPHIAIKNSEITTAATGNVDAGNIEVNFSDKLNLDSSLITTTANLGNGGDVHINGGGLIELKNAGFLTSVSGANGNGGDIDVNANALIMNNAVIQANAVGGSGGDINLRLQTLIPSQSRLVLGGSRVFWQPDITGFNVIQAASASGVNGAIHVTSPQFDISGSISGLNSAGLVLPTLNRNPCQDLASTDSSLSRGGKGGLPANEAKMGFITFSSMSGQSDSNENSLPAKKLTQPLVKLHSDYPCTTPFFD